MFRSLFACLTVLALACTAHADRPEKPAARRSPAGPVSPPPSKLPSSAEQRAREILAEQFKALPEDNAALLKTFTKDAYLLLPSFASLAHDPTLELAAQLTRVHPHSEMKRIKLGRVVAGGNDAMIWFAADYEVVVASYEPGDTPADTTHEMRILELADASSGWKVVAGAVTEIRPLLRRLHPKLAGPSPTEPGPLVPLLVSPENLSRALATDPVILLGTEATERAVGQTAAKALLARWKKLPLAIEEVSKVHEVRTAAWGYAAAYVNLAKPGGAPYRMSAFLIAVPAPGGAWSVVAVNYAAF